MEKPIPYFIENYVFTHLEEFDLVAKGLAAGIFRLGDDYEEARVYYDIKLWGGVADKIAPEYSNKLDEGGSINGFSHTKIDDSVGYFHSDATKNKQEVMNLADLLVKMQKRPF